MALHGHSKIELFDAKTGAPIRTVEDDNLVTNFIRDIMSTESPAILSVITAKANTSSVLGVDNLFGGIKIYSEPLNEDPDDYYQSSKNMVGHADNLTYADVDTSRGSYNSALSENGVNYVKKVWDFTAEQGNGTIASVGLTSVIGGRMGGPNELPAVMNANSIVGLLSDANYVVEFMDDTKNSNSMNAKNPRPFFTDIQNNKLYAVGYPGTGSDVVIYEFELPVTKHSLFEKLYYSLAASGARTRLTLSDHTITSVLDCSDIFTSPFSVFFSIADGEKVYLISGATSGATTNTYMAPGASRTFKTYNARTKSTEPYTLTNNTGHEINYTSLGNGAVNNGYLYVATRDGFLAYINLNNNGDSGIVTNPEGSPLVIKNINLPVCMKMADMFVVAQSGIISASSETNERCYYVYDINKTKYLNIHNAAFSSLNLYGCERGTIDLFKGMTSFSAYYKSTSGTATYYMYILSFINWNALTTINNLEAPVTKTADMTMRITYTITEVE